MEEALGVRPNGMLRRGRYSHERRTGEDRLYTSLAAGKQNRTKLAVVLGAAAMILLLLSGAAAHKRGEGTSSWLRQTKRLTGNS